MGEFARYKESKTSGEDHLFYGGEISHQAGVKFSNHFIKLFQKIGIPGISFHCLRHTNATRLTEVIQDVSVTSKLLGHANLNTTTTYVQRGLDAQKEAVEKFANHVLA